MAAGGLSRSAWVFVLALLFAAAVFHAGWNLLLKQVEEKHIATWWALVASAACSLPVLAFSPISIIAVWPYVLASAILEALYYSVLAQAYRYGDFSLVYPIARGAAPALLAIWSVLVLGERLQPLGVMGLGLVVGGLVVVGSSAWLSQRRLAVGRASVVLALCVAVCISFYSVIDGAAVKHNPPAGYTTLIFAATTALLTPVVIARHGLPAVVGEWKRRWRRLVAIGLLTFLAYSLVLTAYSLAQISYVGAIREVSIVVGAVAGWRLLGEELGKVRVIGAIVVFAGILVIALQA